MNNKAVFERLYDKLIALHHVPGFVRVGLTYPIQDTVAHAVRNAVFIAVRSAEDKDT